MAVLESGSSRWQIARTRRPSEESAAAVRSQCAVSMGSRCHGSPPFACQPQRAIRLSGAPYKERSKMGERSSKRE